MERIQDAGSAGDETKQRRKNRRNTLAGNVLLIFGLITVVGVVTIVIGFGILFDYQGQMKSLEYRITELYISQREQSFTGLNTTLRQMLYRGEKIQSLIALWQVAEGEEEYRQTISRQNAENALKDEFDLLRDTYGSSFDFFYYDRESGRMLEGGGGSYAERSVYIEFIEEQLQKGSLPNTKDSRWFLMGDYICTIYGRGEETIGGWISIRKFARDMFSLSPGEGSIVEVYDPDTEVRHTFRVDEKGNLEDFLDEGASVEISSYYQVPGTTFYCRLGIDTSGVEGTLALFLTFILVGVVYMSIVGCSLLFAKRNIFDRVNYFYENLLKFKDTAEFNEETGLVEFSETGKVLNQLSQEIKNLKIEMYEQQLERQRIAFDYAQIQIRPHFYINCLNVIYSMAQVNRISQIQEITLHVSRYLRYIFKSSLDTVSVESEVEFTRTYLKILECTKAMAYQCQIQIDDGKEDFGIPPLLIQTFVENSIKHNTDMEGGTWPSKSGFLGGESRRTRAASSRFWIMERDSTNRRWKTFRKDGLVRTGQGVISGYRMQWQGFT